MQYNDARVSWRKRTMAKGRKEKGRNTQVEREREEEKI
jgi:hypothetical protein